MEDGTLEKQYRVQCGMPYCRSGRTLSISTNGKNGSLTKHDCRSILRREGWSKRKVLGWTCGAHDGYERRQAKEVLSEETSKYGNRHG
jgi:hypothetical protein